MKILIVDDEKDIVSFLSRALKSRAHVIDAAYSGDNALFMIKSNHYDLIVLDCQLPELSGQKILEETRKEGIDSPVLVLTVQADLVSKEKMFSLKADDYLTKPFLIEEFLWRAEALMRRPKKIERPSWNLGQIALHAREQIATRRGRKIYLTAKEYALLELFFRRQGEILSRSQIMDQVWDNSADPFSNTIEAHILSLRKKLNKKGERDYIHTFSGRGYKFSLKRY